MLILAKTVKRQLFAKQTLIDPAKLGQFIKRGMFIQKRKPLKKQAPEYMSAADEYEAA